MTDEPPLGDAAVLATLETGTLYRFADWPVRAVPVTGNIVYTVWDRAGRLIHAGFTGRGTRGGWVRRFASHAGGRRLGDSFCLLVGDRLVLPALRDRIDEIAAGTLQLDDAMREHVRAELAFRFVPVADGRLALRIERLVRRGALAAGRPLLNPL